MGKERKKEKAVVGVLVSRFGLSLGRLARLALNSSPS
jgi:ATP/ADP translocase